MACLREYPEAKTFAGGMRRVTEIRSMLEQHTGMVVSPGYLVYGLDTYQQMLCRLTERVFSSWLPSIAKGVRYLIRYAAGEITSRVVRDAQGLYADGWAGPMLRYMLPESSGALTFEGSTPAAEVFRGQQVSIFANGIHLGQFELPPGDFHLTVPLPPKLESQPLTLKIKAARAVRFTPANGDGNRRRLAYLVKSIRRAGTPVTWSATTRDLTPLSSATAD